MKVVVFGGAGFIGSHVSDMLTQSGHKVTVFDTKTSPYLNGDQEMVIGDILDADAVLKSTKGVDAVYHFAGVADIEVAKDNPHKTINTNVIGTLNILEACRQNKVKRFVFASTFYVYSQAGSFYRVSKQACELMIECYHQQYDLDFTVLRYGSLYGPRADDSNWLHKVLKQGLKEKKIVRHGAGQELREYIHVYDAARLTVKVLDDEFKNEYVILAGHQPIRIKDLMLMIKEILHNEVELVFLSEGHDSHYDMTPYHFKPRLAKRLIDSRYVDLGQGLLEMLNDLYETEVNKEHKHIV